MPGSAQGGVGVLEGGYWAVAVKFRDYYEVLGAAAAFDESRRLRIDAG